MDKIAIAGSLIFAFATLGYAQSAMPPAAYVSANDIVLTLATSMEQRPALGVGTIVSGDDFNINFIRRNAQAGAIIHEQGTELHYITEGAGILVTGGRSIRPPGGGSANIEGGSAQRVTVGDAILIPAGTPHQYTAVEGVVGYLEVRFKAAQY